MPNLREGSLKEKCATFIGKKNVLIIDLFGSSIVKYSELSIISESTSVDQIKDSVFLIINYHMRSRDLQSADRVRTWYLQFFIFSLLEANFIIDSMFVHFSQH